MSKQCKKCYNVINLLSDHESTCPILIGMLIKKDAPVNTNPKEIKANQDMKSPMEYLVMSMMDPDARCHKHGADKYGKLNWREAKIKASTYVGAIMRHLVAWESGQNLDLDSGLNHLTHIRACCAVVLDAIDHNTFIDDRGRTEVISPPEAENTGESFE